MARFEPPTTEVTDTFWDATRDQTYLVQWCGACDVPIFYPREVCPTCLSADTLEWRASTGNATVHAVSVQYRPADPIMWPTASRTASPSSTWMRATASARCA
jgi:uncharacterized OB-fold protein